MSAQTQASTDGTEQRRFRDALGRFATGVTVVTTFGADKVHGMTANGFMSVSLDPPLVVVSISRSARLHELLEHSGVYGVNVLSNAQRDLSQHFAGKPVDDLRVGFIDTHGAPLIPGALAHVSAEVVDAHRAGDHTLFVGKVHHFDLHPGEPLIFHSGGYRALMDAFADPTFTERWDGFCLDPSGPTA